MFHLCVTIRDNLYDITDIRGLISRTIAVCLCIGISNCALFDGASAQVLFAGLVPTFAQLYQVNVQIPTGLKSGDQTLTLSVSGQQSAPVTIVVQ